MSKNASNIKVIPCSSSKVNAALKHKALKQSSVSMFFCQCPQPWWNQENGNQRWNFNQLLDQQKGSLAITEVPFVSCELRSNLNVLFRLQQHWDLNQAFDFKDTLGSIISKSNGYGMWDLLIRANIKIALTIPIETLGFVHQNLWLETLTNKSPLSTPSTKTDTLLDQKSPSPRRLWVFMHVYACTQKKKKMCAINLMTY